jgi:outer membrane murein-binding lipoprotein Lpp
MKKITILAAAAAVLVLAACGSSPHHPAAAASRTHTASAAPARPAGCDQVAVVVGTVRGEMENAPDDATEQQAYHQLTSLAKSVPEGPLRIDVDRANFDMTEYWLRVTTGESSTKWAGRFAADLRRLESDCA